MSLKNWLVEYIYNRELKRLFPLYFKGILADIGCGTNPYKKMSLAHASRHIGIEHPDSLHGTENADIISNAYHTGLKDESVDSIFCSAVLEHLEEPQKAVMECHRILKSDGYGIFSAPFIWQLHEEPRDFFRYTEFGLLHLFKTAGLEVVEIIPLSGFFVTMAQMLVNFLYSFNQGILKRIPVIPILGIIILATGYGLDLIYKNKRWTWAWVAVVRKKKSA